MLLESRLEELVADGDRRDAAELATAALKNDEVIEVSVRDDAVEVETRRFRGVHDVRRGGDQPSIVQQGEYEVKGELSFTFTTATMHDDALDAARARLGVLDDGATDAGSSATSAGEGSRRVDAATAGDAAPATDGGGGRAGGRDGTLARLGATLRSLL